MLPVCIRCVANTSATTEGQRSDKRLGGERQSRAQGSDQTVNCYAHAQTKRMRRSKIGTRIQYLEIHNGYKKRILHD